MCSGIISGIMNSTFFSHIRTHKYHLMKNIARKFQKFSGNYVRIAFRRRTAPGTFRATRFILPLTSFEAPVHKVTGDHGSRVQSSAGKTDTEKPEILPSGRISGSPGSRGAVQSSADYSAGLMAPIGQTPAQVPQSTQRLGSM